MECIKMLDEKVVLNYSHESVLEIVKTAVEFHKETLVNKKLDIEVYCEPEEDFPDYLKIDMGKTSQILVNLISDAINMI
jgi:signal transduction histidine kinase